MLPFFLLAAAAAPPTAVPGAPLDIHCVALLAIVSGEQLKGRGWRDLPPLKDEGGRYAGIIGGQAMAGGRTRELVRGDILAEVAKLEKAGRPARDDVDLCVARMRSALAEADR